MKHKTRTKALSWLLSLAMLFSVVPGMSLTAYAAPTEELLTTITATGKEQASYSTANVATVSFSYTANGSSSYTNNGTTATWGWWGYGWTATVTPADGYTITKCVFYDDKDRTATDSEAPFVVETTEEDKTPKVNGTPILANTSKGITKIEVYGYVTPATSYSVTITAGDNMTKTTGSGDAEQTGLSGAMTDVVYTANEGYYFPENYSVTAVNGISVTRNSYTQITVSGTPSADAAIALTAPTAKTTPDAPTAAATDCTTADNNDGKLTGVTTAMEYKKSDAANWTAGTGSDITGLVPGTYYVRVKATETTNESANQELTIKGFISYTVTFKVVNGKWNEGEGDAATADKTVTLTGHDGDTLKLTVDQIPAVGTKPNDTYKAGSWDTTPSADTEITADTTYTYTYAQKDSISQTVTFKVVNGKWDDDTTADKTVTLTGYEGDTLKLAANQIPAVGSKPNDTYKAGSWDVTPSTETAITEATTYTYTYAQKDSISRTVTFKVANGSWNDETTTDKTVTLTGYEGDTLKLTADQIPAVGTKPNDTYKAGSWDVTPSTETEITAATTYTYTYAQKDSISQTVTFKVVNGKWDDDTTADKTVTLTGYEGDTLKLAANQIPAVGSKPNDTYKAGSWDVTPSTETAITEATTYTYTYAQKDSISRTVTFKVVNGSWNDETTTDKTVTLTGYEGDALKLAANQIPAVGTKPNDTYKAGSWDVTPSADTEITEATTYTYTYAQKDTISQTVTFKVVNGKWDDDSTADKSVTLTGYEGDTLKLTADQIPAVGTKPNVAYKAGSWDVTPSTDTEITAATTYTYTYAAKEASVVTKAPEAKILTYNGQAQELITAGTATGGEMQYALGTKDAATQPYTTDIPTATNVGTYYVWYKAIGDAYHTDSDAACVTATIAAPVYYDDPTPSTPAAETVTIPVSGEDETVNVKVEVKDDTATVKEADVDKVLESEEVGTVTVDVSTLKEDVTGVVIPSALLEKVADAVADEDNTADALEIKLPTGSVTLDANAVATITEQADGNDLKLNLDDVLVTELASAQQVAVSDLEIEVVLDAYLTSGGKRISDFNGGSATVKIPYTLKDGQTAQGLVVWYVATDGTRSQVPASYDGKNVVFTVPHFSNYVIAYDAEKAAACPKDDTCPISAFTDADPTVWYHDGVHFVLANGLMNGMGNGKFDPNGSTSRAMIVTILYRLEGKPDVSGKANPFEDVADGQWYTDAVIWAAENKIVEGYGNGRFDPTGDITREQLAAILYRYEQSKGGGFVGAWMFLLDYPDAAEISSWADEAMHWCVMNGIINGKDGKLVPGGDASRAEAATILMRYCTKTAE